MKNDNYISKFYFKYRKIENKIIHFFPLIDNSRTHILFFPKTQALIYPKEIQNKNENRVNPNIS